jgi:hypothetical protein
MDGLRVAFVKVQKFKLSNWVVIPFETLRADNYCPYNSRSRWPKYPSYRGNPSRSCHTGSYVTKDQDRLVSQYYWLTFNVRMLDISNSTEDPPTAEC